MWDRIIKNTHLHPGSLSPSELVLRREHHGDLRVRPVAFAVLKRTPDVENNTRGENWLKNSLWQDQDVELHTNQESARELKPSICAYLVNKCCCKMCNCQAWVFPAISSYAVRPIVDVHIGRTRKTKCLDFFNEEPDKIARTELTVPVNNARKFTFISYSIYMMRKHVSSRYDEYWRDEHEWNALTSINARTTTRLWVATKAWNPRIYAPISTTAIKANNIQIRPPLGEEKKQPLTLIGASARRIRERYSNLEDRHLHWREAPVNCTK